MFDVLELKHRTYAGIPIPGQIPHLTADPLREHQNALQERPQAAWAPRSLREHQDPLPEPPKWTPQALKETCTDTHGGAQSISDAIPTSIFVFWDRTLN